MGRRVRRLRAAIQECKHPSLVSAHFGADRMKHAYAERVEWQNNPVGRFADAVPGWQL